MFVTLSRPRDRFRRVVCQQPIGPFADDQAVGFRTAATERVRQEPFAVSGF